MNTRQYTKIIVTYQHLLDLLDILLGLTYLLIYEVFLFFYFMEENIYQKKKILSLSHF